MSSNEPGYLKKAKDRVDQFFDSKPMKSFKKNVGQAIGNKVLNALTGTANIVSGIFKTGKDIAEWGSRKLEQQLEEKKKLPDFKEGWGSWLGRKALGFVGKAFGLAAYPAHVLKTLAGRYKTYFIISNTKIIRSSLMAHDKYKKVIRLNLGTEKNSPKLIVALDKALPNSVDTRQINRLKPESKKDQNDALVRVEESTNEIIFIITNAKLKEVSYETDKKSGAGLVKFTMTVEGKEPEVKEIYFPDRMITDAIFKETDEGHTITVKFKALRKILYANEAFTNERLEFDDDSEEAIGEPEVVMADVQGAAPAATATEIAGK